MCETSASLPERVGSRSDSDRGDLVQETLYVARKVPTFRHKAAFRSRLWAVLVSRRHHFS
jgi:hypothetical protein